MNVVFFEKIQIRQFLIPKLFLLPFSSLIVIELYEYSLHSNNYKLSYLNIIANPT